MVTGFSIQSALQLHNFLKHSIKKQAYFCHSYKAAWNLKTHNHCSLQTHFIALRTKLEHIRSTQKHFVGFTSSHKMETFLCSNPHMHHATESEAWVCKMTRRPCHGGSLIFRSPGAYPYTTKRALSFPSVYRYSFRPPSHFPLHDRRTRLIVPLQCQALCTQKPVAFGFLEAIVESFLVFRFRTECW